MEVVYSKATIADIPEIYDLINEYAKKNIMLGRSLQYLYENIRSFWVAKEIDKKTKNCHILGLCGFGVSQKNLAEVKSLAVHQDYKKFGIATNLLQQGFAELRNLGVTEVFCLSYVPDFFIKHDFKIIDKEELPHKIWTECIHCPSFPKCDETALIKEL